ncbi:MAG: (Fe-S)-binding protein [Syntrophobacteraceae bacterium]
MGLKVPASSEILTPLLEKCTECGACISECAFLEKYGTPAELAREFLLSEDPDPLFPFECSLCGLCGTVCPEGLDPAAHFLDMRRMLIKDGRGIRPGHSPMMKHEERGTSRLLTFYALPEGCDTVFFPGCSLPGTRPDITLDTYRRLKKSDPALGIVLDCCCKPSHDLGRQDHFLALFGEMRAWLLEHGVSAVLTACPNCYRVFADYGAPLRAESIYEVLARTWERGAGPTGNVVTVHDSCAVRHDEHIHAAVRSLLRAAGCVPEEMVHSGKKTLCCGSGGFADLISPALAGRWAEMRQKEAGGRRLAMYCGACTKRFGSAAHVLDFLFDPEAAHAGKVKIAGPPWTYSNRIWLKRAFGKEVRPAVTRVRDFRVETDRVDSQS